MDRPAIPLFFQDEETMTLIYLLLGGAVMVGIALYGLRAAKRAARAAAAERREAAEMTAYEAEWAAANPPEQPDRDALLLWAETRPIDLVSRTRKPGEGGHDRH